MNIQTCKFIDCSDLFIDDDTFDMFTKMIESTDWITPGNFNRSLLDKDSMIALINQATPDDDDSEENFCRYADIIVERIQELPNDVLIDMEN